MHELGYCEALLAVVQRRAAGRPVHAIGIQAGVRHRLVEDVMQMAWQMVAAGTMHADAITVMEPEVLIGVCVRCGHRFSTPDTLATCPACGAEAPSLTGGDQFALRWLQYGNGAEEVVAAPLLPPPGEVEAHSHDEADATHVHPAPKAMAQGEEG